MGSAGISLPRSQGAGLSASPSLSHSRIEWVWLHWSEYLLARDEFYRWFQKMVVTLEPPVELQLGLKEKQWQLSHAQVLLHNVDSQAVLLDRLLEEAGSLFNRIGDPSVDEDAQKRMKAEYDAVKASAQVSHGWLHHHPPSTPYAHPALRSLTASPSPHPFISHPPSVYLPCYFPLNLLVHLLPSPRYYQASLSLSITPPSISLLILLFLIPIWSLIHQSTAHQLTSLLISSTTQLSTPPISSASS